MLNRSFIAILVAATALLVAVSGCLGVACSCPNGDGANGDNSDNVDNGDDVTAQYPKIASWLAKKDEIIDSGKSFSLVMSAWFTSEEVDSIKAQSPHAKLLAGLTVNFVWDNEGWMTTLETIASYGREEPLEITESMYLRTSGGQKCPFGWASEEWGQEEIYAMDPTSNEWVELVTSFYENVLEQPQHDGIIVDMVIENPIVYWPDAISDDDWVEATKSIMAEIDELNTEDKLVIFNAGREFADIDEYGAFMDGYVMEGFLNGSWGADYDMGLEATEGPYVVIYAADTDDTGVQDLNRMRLGLTLSLLNDNTYFTYDIGPRDHGDAWWFPEYDVDLGQPSDARYVKDGAYWRQFEKGVVVSSPDVDVQVVFSDEHTDVTTGTTSTTFSVQAGDGGIFIAEG
jgi:hypothetical protein